MPEKDTYRRFEIHSSYVASTRPGGVTIQVSTCTPRFYILGTAELIVLKFVT